MPLHLDAVQTRRQAAITARSDTAASHTSKSLLVREVDRPSCIIDCHEATTLDRIRRSVLRQCSASTRRRVRPFPSASSHAKYASSSKGLLRQNTNARSTPLSVLARSLAWIFPAIACVADCQRSTKQASLQAIRMAAAARSARMRQYTTAVWSEHVRCLKECAQAPKT